MPTAVRRSTAWFILGFVIVFVALFSAFHLLAPTNDDRDPVIVGAIVLQNSKSALGGLPLYVYIGDVGSKSASIGISLKGGSQSSSVRILVTNVKDQSCVPGSGISLSSAPIQIGKDTAFYSFHQAHFREVSIIEAKVQAKAQASISCDITDPPERETYTTRSIAFSPPLNNDILSIAQVGGFKPILPVVASIQRVTGSSEFSTSGGEVDHATPEASIMEAFDLTAQDPILRAHWIDDPSQSAQSFWLFFWAAIAGIGFSMILEAARPWIESIS